MKYDKYSKVDDFVNVTAILKEIKGKLPKTTDIKVEFKKRITDKKMRILK